MLIGNTQLMSVYEDTYNIMYFFVLRVSISDFFLLSKYTYNGMFILN